MPQETFDDIAVMSSRCEPARRRHSFSVTCRGMHGDTIEAPAWQPHTPNHLPTVNAPRPVTAVDPMATNG
jgi:hypothetical protein